MSNHPLIIAYDLGTGGCKASAYDAEGHCLGQCFESVNTIYPQTEHREQAPDDWWKAVVDSTKKLLKEPNVDADRVVGLGLSGHSLALVPMGLHGELMRKTVPIWSDTRPTEQQLDRFFSIVDEETWYGLTGNGFPAPLYTIFKLMWLADHEPDLYAKIGCVLGTKDYVNYRMTGAMATDPSYASGTGVYNLKNGAYDPELLKASGCPLDIFPNIMPSTQSLGTLTRQASQALGLPETVEVVCGGVDNSCMALGSKAFKNGRLYNSLGTSSWIAVSTDEPILDTKTRPYVFAHVVPGMYASATAIFSAGNSLRWMRDQLCLDLLALEEQGAENAYVAMDRMAEDVPVGSNRLLFNPSLAGGSSLDDSAMIRGAFSGLDLGHQRKDMIRAVMEGVSMGLKVALDALAAQTTLEDEMLVVGGGAQSRLWRQIYADVYGMPVVQTSIDEQAGALGAAALVAVGLGLWQDFSPIDDLHEEVARHEVSVEHHQDYQKLLGLFKELSHSQSQLGEKFAKIQFNQGSES
jgi:xylulokinase